MLDNVTVGTNLNATSDLFVALIEVSTSYDLVKGMFFSSNDVYKIDSVIDRHLIKKCVESESESF